MRVHRKNGVKIFTVTAVALLSAVCLSGCANERVEKEFAHRTAGIECMQSGDYVGAVSEFDTALSYCLGTIGDAEKDICYYKAAAQYASGDVEGALETYDALVAYDDTDATAYYTRGCLHLHRGEGELAFADFDNAALNNKNDYELYINIYKNLAAYNLIEQGKEYLSQALDIKGDGAMNLAYRGEIYMLLGEYVSAEKELNAALKKGSVEANLVLAQLAEEQGDGESAEVYYKAYVESGAADAEAFNSLAKIGMAKMDYGTALAYIEQGLALEQVPNKRELMQNQIICMENLADFNGAWKVIQEYITLYPNDLEVQREYVFLKNRQQSVDEGLAIQAVVETGEASTEDGEADTQLPEESTAE